jgi:hypothetical protein
VRAAPGRPPPKYPALFFPSPAVGIPDALRRLWRIVLQSSSLRASRNQRCCGVAASERRVTSSPLGPPYFEPIAHPALHKRRADLETWITLVTVAAGVSKHAGGDETLPLPIIDTPSYRSSAGVDQRPRRPRRPKSGFAETAMGKSAAADQRLWPSDDTKVRFNLPVPKLFAPPGVIRSRAGSSC